jgi:hypothetical protein
MFYLVFSSAKLSIAFVFISDNPFLFWLRQRVKGVFRIYTIKAMRYKWGEVQCDVVD